MFLTTLIFCGIYSSSKRWSIASEEDASRTDTFLFFARNYIKQVQGLLEKYTVFMDQDARERRANLSILGSFMWLILEWPQVHHTDTAEKVLTDELAPAKPVGNRQQKRGKEGKHDGETNV